MRRRGRPVLGAIAGLLFGISLAVVLVSGGMVALDSPLVSVLPVAGLVLFAVLAFAAPFGGRTVTVTAPTPNPTRDESSTDL